MTVGIFRKRRSIEALRIERQRLVAQLEQARHDAAWCRASDDPFELQEARRWQAQADALQRALDALDAELLKAELDTL